MDLYKDSDTLNVFYIARAFAVEEFIYRRFDQKDPRYAVYGYGENLPSCNFKTLYAGEIHGMGGYSQPGWTEYSPECFKTAEEARASAKSLVNYGYNFRLIADTIRVYKITKHAQVSFIVQEQP